MEESCLRCHSTPDRAPGDMVRYYGDRRSFNRRTGETVSAVSIRIPLSQAFHEANRFSFKLSGILLLLLLGLFLCQYFLGRRLIFLPLNAIRRKAVQISTDHSKLGEKIEAPRGKELKELAEAFNVMSDSLRGSRDHLEDLVGQRNAALEKANDQLRAEIDERTLAEQEKEQLIAELRNAFAKVKTLSGMLPICALCKKVRDDEGYWNGIEDYISKHSEAAFSHGICPDCAKAVP